MIATVLTKEILDFEGVIWSCGCSSPKDSDEVYCARPTGECFADVIQKHETRKSKFRIQISEFYEG